MGAKVGKSFTEYGQSRPHSNVPDPAVLVPRIGILKRAAPWPQNADFVVVGHPPVRNLREVTLRAARTWVQRILPVQDQDSYGSLLT
ncbi:MAG: hypothetical protein WB116_07745 [Candidatus Dormiibacterota bacterium]